MNVLEEITRTQLETIYRVMIKRIAKGFTAEQLSFLIGKEDNYIRSVEMLDEPCYSISELERIALALEETNFKSFFPRVHDESEIIVGIESYNDGIQRGQSYIIVDDNGTDQPLFAVKEDVFENFGENMLSEENSEIARDAVMLLIRAGYFFEPKMPFQVFQSINKFLTIPLSPFYVRQALHSFCPVGDQALLKRIGGGRMPYVYSEV